MTATDQPTLPRARKRRRSFASSRTIMALMLREMATTYGRNPGGYLWAVLEPVAGVALMSFVFALAFRNPALGISFPMFYASGMVPFIAFNDLTSKLARALQFSKPLLTYPTVTFLDAILARFVLNMITQLMVGYIVFVGLMILFETRVVPDIWVIAQAYALTAFLALGVGITNCFLSMRFPAWQQIWSVLMRPMFIISGIFFLYGTIPQPYRDYLWYNPLIHIVGLMRRGFYPTYDAPYVSQLYVSGVSMALITVGLFLLWRFHRDLLQN